MFITDIKYDEKKSLFAVEIDNNILFYISYEVYDKFDLTNDKELDAKTYNTLEKENDYQLAKRNIEKFINYKMRTVNEVNKKLISYTKNQDAIKKIIDYYIKLGLLNDEIYTQEYIKNCLNFKNYSKKITKFKLIQKGIEKKLISKYLDKYDDDIEIKNAKLIFEKKYKNYDKNDFSQKQKAYNFLLSKGFNYEIINRVIG